MGGWFGEADADCKLTEGVDDELLVICCRGCREDATVLQKYFDHEKLRTGAGS